MSIEEIEIIEQQEWIVLAAHPPVVLKWAQLCQQSERLISQHLRYREMAGEPQLLVTRSLWSWATGDEAATSTGE